MTNFDFLVNYPFKTNTQYVKRYFPRTLWSSMTTNLTTDSYRHMYTSIRRSLCSLSPSSTHQSHIQTYTSDSYFLLLCEQWPMTSKQMRGQNIITFPCKWQVRAWCTQVSGFTQSDLFSSWCSSTKHFTSSSINYPNKTHLIDLIFVPLCLWYQANRFCQYPNTWGLEEVRATWRLELQRSPLVPEMSLFVLCCFVYALFSFSSLRWGRLMKNEDATHLPWG